MACIKLRVPADLLNTHTHLVSLLFDYTHSSLPAPNNAVIVLPFLCSPAYPFFPMLSAIAEAAIQLPDDTDGPDSSLDGEVPEQGVDLLMQQRRLNMAEVHDDLLANLIGNLTMSN